MPFAQGNPQFKSGQMRTQAAVDPAAERDMAVCLSMQLKVVGAVELAFVDIGGADQGHDVVAFLHGASGDLCVPCGDASDGHHWGFPTEELLDGPGDAVGLLDELLASLGMLREVAIDAIE